jgi:hypothetical protein
LPIVYNTGCLSEVLLNAAFVNDFVRHPVTVVRAVTSIVTKTADNLSVVVLVTLVGDPFCKSDLVFAVKAFAVWAYLSRDKLL